MTDKDFEIIVRYNSWNVEVYGNNSNLLTNLNCNLNSWFSNYHSGTATINGAVYSVRNNNQGIVLNLNNREIGQVIISKNNLFERSATIELFGEIFLLKRENLKQLFAMTDMNGNIIMSVEGKVYKEKQRNFFGLLFFDDKLYHSVFLANHSIDNTLPLYLLAICGYCIRVFLQIDMGEYSGLVFKEGETSR